MAGKFKNFLWGALPFVAIIILWYSFSLFEVFPNWLLPSPAETGGTFLRLLVSGQLGRLIYISAINIIPAFLLAFMAAIVIGSVIGTWETARKIFLPLISAFYTIPSITWLPFIIIYFGFNRSAIWVVIFISAFLRMIHNIIGGVRNVNTYWILAGENLNLNRLEIITKIVIPGALPQIIIGMRQGFNSAWRSLIAAEMLISTFGGLGKYIWLAQWTLDFNKVFSGILAIALVGVLVELLVFKKLEQSTLVKWGFVEKA